MKMLHQCTTTHVLWVKWDMELNGGIHFCSWPEEMSGWGQIRSNCEMHFLQKKKNAYIVQFCLNITNRLFLSNTIRHAKKCVQKRKVITFTSFLTIARPKIRTLFEIWYACCLCMVFQYIFRFRTSSKFGI